VAGKSHEPPGNPLLQAGLGGNILHPDLLQQDFAALDERVIRAHHLSLPRGRVCCNVLQHTLHQAKGVAAEASLPGAVAATACCLLLVVIVQLQTSKKTLMRRLLPQLLLVWLSRFM
jgi:hypothetical protein